MKVLGTRTAGAALIFLVAASMLLTGCGWTGLPSNSELGATATAAALTATPAPPCVGEAEMDEAISVATTGVEGQGERTSSLIMEVRARFGGKAQDFVPGVILPRGVWFWINHPLLNNQEPSTPLSDSVKKIEPDTGDLGLFFTEQAEWKADRSGSYIAACPEGQP